MKYLDRGSDSIPVANRAFTSPSGTHICRITWMAPDKSVQPESDISNGIGAVVKNMPSKYALNLTLNYQ